MELCSYRLWIKKTIRPVRGGTRGVELTGRSGRSHGREVERNGEPTVGGRNQRGEAPECLARAPTSQPHDKTASKSNLSLRWMHRPQDRTLTVRHFCASPSCSCHLLTTVPTLFTLGAKDENATNAIITGIVHISIAQEVERHLVEHLAGSLLMMQEVSTCWKCWAIVLIRSGILETSSRLELLARGNPTKARPRIPSGYCCQGRNRSTARACSGCGAMEIWAPAGWDSTFRDGQDRLARVVL